MESRKIKRFFPDYLVNLLKNRQVMEAVITQPEQIRPDYETERGKAMPSKNHALIQSRILVTLSKKYGNQYDFLSEVSLDMAGKWVVPDIAVYPQLTFDSLHDETRMAQMPLGVIEILSSSQTQEELVEKSTQYFAAGIQSYWLVNPLFKIIHVIHNSETYRNFIGGTLTDEKLGLSLELEEVFR
ncbi:Uma2 family endonuclease [Larkinella humicola]|uniref:Uma2 family endonuclease n=2 Tax=Larkinella humicola TaxID=2607654 RepID=A0A5N1JCW0_9BACT|nr:Uma2 family endonuclease [Larkinella humicola]